MIYGLPGWSLAMPDILYPTPVNEYRPLPPSQHPAPLWQTPSWANENNNKSSQKKKKTPNKKNTKQKSTGAYNTTMSADYGHAVSISSI